MSSLGHKIDFAVVLRVKHANPNGDPFNGNRPRTDYNGNGEISDVCLKRKMRDRLMEADRNLRAVGRPKERRRQRACVIAQRKRSAASSARPKRPNWRAKNWFDVRAFGQLFALPKKNKRARSRRGRRHGCFHPHSRPGDCPVGLQREAV